MLAFSTPSLSTVLLGSVHLLPQNAPCLGAVRTLVEASQRVLLEADKSAIDPALFFYDDGGDLRDVVGLELYSQVLDMATQLGLDAGEVSRRPPWSAALWLFYARMASAGVISDHGIDNYALEAAVALDKEVRFLEEPGDGLLCLREAPLDEQLQGLARLVEEPERAEQDLLAMLRGWVKGDSEVLESILEDRLMELPCAYGCLVERRNRAWIRRLPTLLHPFEDNLIVVGALHLVGGTGLPRLLSAAGLHTSQEDLTTLIGASASPPQPG